MVDQTLIEKYGIIKPSFSPCKLICIIYRKILHAKLGYCIFRASIVFTDGRDLGRV